MSEFPPLFCPRCKTQIGRIPPGRCVSCHVKLKPLYIDSTPLFVFLTSGGFLIMALLTPRALGKNFFLADVSLLFSLPLLFVPLAVPSWLIRALCLRGFAEVKENSGRQFSLIQALYIIFLAAVFLCMFFGRIEDYIPVAVGAYCLWGAIEIARYVSRRRTRAYRHETSPSES